MAFTIESNDTAAVPARQSVWYDTDLAILVAGVAGTGVLTGCAATAQGTPDMTLAVAAGTIQPSAGAASVAVTGGNVTITTAHATLPRIDLVTASTAGVKTVTAGTAATSPKPPALPSGHIGLAMVDVPAADTAIQTAQVTDKRATVFASGLAQSYIGYNTVGASFETLTVNRQLMKKFTLAAAGTLISIDFHIKATATDPTNFVVGVLIDASGLPTNVVAMSSTGSTLGLKGGNAARWVTVPIGIYLAAGDYWLALTPTLIGASGAQLAYDGGSDRYFSVGAFILDGDYAAQTDSTRKYSIRASVIR